MNNSTRETLAHKNSFLAHMRSSMLLSLQTPTFALIIRICVFSTKNCVVFHVPQNLALFILLLVNFIQLFISLPLYLRFFVRVCAVERTIVYETEKSFKHLQRLMNPWTVSQVTENPVIYSRYYASCIAIKRSFKGL